MKHALYETEKRHTCRLTIAGKRESPMQQKTASIKDLPGWPGALSELCVNGRND